jgi:hypothetical protein
MVKDKIPLLLEGIQKFKNTIPGLFWIGYNDTSNLLTDEDGNQYILVRQMKRRNSTITYELSGYGIFKNKFTTITTPYIDEAKKKAEEFAVKNKVK